MGRIVVPIRRPWGKSTLLRASCNYSILDGQLSVHESGQAHGGDSSILTYTLRAGLVALVRCQHSCTSVSCSGLRFAHLDATLLTAGTSIPRLPVTKPRHFFSTDLNLDIGSPVRLRGKKDRNGVSHVSSMYGSSVASRVGQLRKARKDRGLSTERGAHSITIVKMATRYFASSTEYR